MCSVSSLCWPHHLLDFYKGKIIQPILILEEVTNDQKQFQHIEFIEQHIEQLSVGLYGKCKLLCIEATNGILVFLDDPSIKMSILMWLMSASSNYKALVPMKNMFFSYFSCGNNSCQLVSDNCSIHAINPEHCVVADFDKG